MFRILLSLAALIVLVIPTTAQNDWTTYYDNEQLTIETKYSECHYPEKGVHSEYLLVKITNKTGESIDVTYKLDKWYNDSKINPDKSDFTVVVPANNSVEATCDDLKQGLYAYSKILDLEPKSRLSKIELNALTLNGSEVIR